MCYIYIARAIAGEVLILVAMSAVTRWWLQLSSA